MRICTHRLTLAALIAWSAPATLPGADYVARDFLPLAVGNSWTLGHFVYDLRHFDPESYGPAPEWFAWEDSNGVFTLTVERTEEIEGNTYYVLSEMPSTGWPPPPPNFIAGKKLRWVGARLMEHTGNGEQVLHSFREGPYQDPVRPVPETGFGFPVSASDYAGWGLEERYGDQWRARRHVIFLAGFGLRKCSETIDVSDYTFYGNEINAIEAVLIESTEGAGGASGASGTVVRRVRAWDARRGERGTITPSSVSSSSWGQVKGSGR